MKEFSPKPDLWSKIQQRKDFDSQVKGHVTNLPERMPKADLWAGIESEFDRKTPVIPLWKYRMAAASIALILAISGIAYLQFGEKTQDTQLITEVKTRVPEIIIPEVAPSIDSELEKEKSEQVEVEKPKTNATQQKLSNRVSPTAIEIPRLDLPDISIENSLISEVITPPSTEQEAQKTLHKVRISWGIQEKSKLHTKFGSNTPDDISNQQLGFANQPKNSIKVNFHKQ